jgi:hypothetical protein
MRCATRVARCAEITGDRSSCPEAPIPAATRCWAWLAARKSKHFFADFRSDRVPRHTRVTRHMWSPVGGQSAHHTRCMHLVFFSLTPYRDTSRNSCARINHSIIRRCATPCSSRRCKSGLMSRECIRALDRKPPERIFHAALTAPASLHNSVAASNVSVADYEGSTTSPRVHSGPSVPRSLPGPLK